MIYTKNDNTLVIEVIIGQNALMESHYMIHHLTECIQMVLLDAGKEVCNTTSLHLDMIATLNRLVQALSLNEQQLEAIENSIIARKVRDAALFTS